MRDRARNAAVREAPGSVLVPPIYTGTSGLSGLSFVISRSSGTSRAQFGAEAGVPAEKLVSPTACDLIAAWLGSGDDFADMLAREELLLRLMDVG